jgi:hypothetical protein
MLFPTTSVCIGVNTVGHHILFVNSKSIEELE